MLVLWHKIKELFFTVSNKMDYLAFISDIEKVWTEKTNSKIAQTYSLNRSVLPALIKLHREWRKTFDDLENDVAKLELELNHYKSDKNLFNNVELEKKLKELKKVVIELQEENEKYCKEVKLLKEDNYTLRNSSIFKKLVG